MWLWILVDLCIITKVYGYSSGAPEDEITCESMSPVHKKNGIAAPAQDTDPPFEVTYTLGQSKDPITVCLQSKSLSEPFIGFMLEAREKGMVDGGIPVGKFILLDPQETKLLRCSNLEGSAVSQSNNLDKTLIKVNWTAQGAELDIIFRATFVRSYSKFWKAVDVNVILPPDTTTLPPSTQTSTPASTITSNPSSTPVSTPASTPTSTQTSAPTSTPVSTPTSTPTSTQTSVPTSTITSNPTSTPVSTPASTPTSTPTSTQTSAPTSTQTSAPTSTQTSAPTSTQTGTPTSTPTSTTKPSTTESSTTPPKNGTYKNLQAPAVMMACIILSVVVKEELSNILTITLTDSPFSRRLSKVFKITCSQLCGALEISTLVLFCVDDPFRVTLVVLMSVVIVINIIDLVIVSLPFGPSHELKEICDLADKLCSVIHIGLITAVVFMDVLEIEDQRKKRKESWLLTVMIAYVVWILLFAIWVFILNVYKNTKPGMRQLRRSHSVNWMQQRKRELSACKVIVITVSVIFGVGTMSFTAAVTVGIF